VRIPWTGEEGRRKAFTQSEIAAVIGILAVLIALVLPTVIRMRGEARVCQAESRLKQISSALELFFLTHKSYPPTGSELSTVLAPFVDSPTVFENPLAAENHPGETISSLYRAPRLGELDSPNNYLTAMISGDGSIFVVLKTGHIVERKTNPPVPDDPASLEGQFRTQTQGGWGTKAKGGNPGAYRDANFDAAFPGGLVVGSIHKITLTSSAAVEALLPQSGTARALTASATNPSAKSIKNVLVGQVVALSLSVGFDLYDPDFSASGTALGSLVVVEGQAAGMTVGQVLAVANKVLGGEDVAGWSPSAVNVVVSAINENFVDALTDNGYLRLP